MVGTATGIASISQTSSLRSECLGDRCPADKKDDIDRATALGYVSTGSFVAAGLGATLGLVALFTLDEDEPARADVTLEPVVGAGALGVQGRF